MMTKAIIFDMDGLLADTEMIGYKVISDIVSEYDKKISIEEYVTNFCGKTNKDSTQHLIDMFELPMDQEEVIRNLTDRDFELIKDGVDMKYGAEEIVKYFKDKGYKLALATSSKFERVELILKPANLFEYFDEFVTANDVTKGKPNPEVFLKAAKKLGEKPEDCLVLEDSEFGIEAASRAGIPVICIPDLEIPAEEYLSKTYKVLDDLLELKKFY